MAKICYAQLRHWQHRTNGCGLPYIESTDVPRVRRHKHEEDVAFFGDSSSHAEQSWLLLLPVALSNAGAPTGGRVPSAGMPGSSAGLQPLHDGTGDLRCTSGACGAVRTAAAMVMGSAI
ncbi:MAG TPA: hypothetical protein VHE81_16985 [Lacipirellulaceae bacterium]|nr:hypothetical protein [Lacipirellulaceae bacterium]